MAKSYYITAQRTSGERMYYVVPAINNASMVPNAESLAARYPVRFEAEWAMQGASACYKGLVNWEVCRSVGNL